MGGSIRRALDNFVAAVKRQPPAAGKELHSRVLPVAVPPCSERHVLQVWVKDDADRGGLWQCFVDDEGNRTSQPATYQDFSFTKACAPPVDVAGL